MRKNEPQLLLSLIKLRRWFLKLGLHDAESCKAGRGHYLAASGASCINLPEQIAIWVEIVDSGMRLIGRLVALPAA